MCIVTGIFSMSCGKIPQVFVCLEHDDIICFVDRVRWTAPELLATNSEPTLAGDKFSYAITLWQIMSHGAIPAENLSDEVVSTPFILIHSCMKFLFCLEHFRMHMLI